MSSPAYESRPLPAAQLRWRCDPASFPFATTHEVEPLEGVVGQDTAVEALRFGLEVHAPGQNIFVRGLTGTGRSTLLKRLLESIRPDCPHAPDRVFVHNFESADRPRLLTLPRGTGHRFRRLAEDFARFIREDLKGAIASDTVRAQGGKIERKTSKAVEGIGQPFDDELRAAGLTLVQIQVGSARRPLIVPLIEDEPAPPDRMEALLKEGKISEEEIEALGEKIGAFSQRLQEIGDRIQEIQNDGRDAFRTMVQTEARGVLESAARRLLAEFPDAHVKTYIDAVIEDVITEHLGELDGDLLFTKYYDVNLIQSHADESAAPVIIENTPSVPTLMGTVDLASIRREEDGPLIPHMMVRGGSLLRADGGYLLLEARDLITAPGAWASLIRTLRCGCVEMMPPDLPSPWRVPAVKPEPIPVDIKVILLGDTHLYYMLDSMDADFPNLFKVLADFDSVVERTDESLGFYAGVLSRIAKEERLPPFDRGAVALLCEHGARIAGQAGKLTTRFGRLADIAREGAFLTTRSGQDRVSADHIRQAVRRTKHRADLPARRFREMIANGTIRVRTRGQAIGQINGLAVISAGPMTYGFPQRITATIGAGTAGAINIEREAQLSGAIHNKGFYILGGLLRYLLKTDHPLAFSASVAFEQSYGGIDGDSASGAEMCCLLSALTGLPLRQDRAMTGAIDQMGSILPIGAVNEKIEGFFDTCCDQEGGLTGSQGVVIPKLNIGELMLREDVAEACANGRFHVHAVDTIHEAIGIFTGLQPGQRGDDGAYPDDSVLGRAVAQAQVYWQMARGDSTPPPPPADDAGEA